MNAMPRYFSLCFLCNFDLRYLIIFGGTNVSKTEMPPKLNNHASCFRLKKYFVVVFFFLVYTLELIY